MVSLKTTSAFEPSGFLKAALTTPFAFAQQPPGVSQSLVNLADQPATHVGFTFDRAMLDFAGSFIDSGGPDSRHAVAALNSITVDRYHYPRPAFYTPEVMSSIIGAYHAAGWKHLVNANGSPARSARPWHR